MLSLRDLSLHGWLGPTRLVRTVLGLHGQLGLPVPADMALVCMTGLVLHAKPARLKFAWSAWPDKLGLHGP